MCLKHSGINPDMHVPAGKETRRPHAALQTRAAPFCKTLCLLHWRYHFVWETLDWLRLRRSSSSRATMHRPGVVVFSDTFTALGICTPGCSDPGCQVYGLSGCSDACQATEC